MKKVLLFLTIAITLFFGIRFFFNKKTTIAYTDIAFQKDQSEADKEEELEARSRQEFLMTVDPALGYVPAERLLVAEKKADQLKVLNQQSKVENILAGLTWVERGPKNVGGRTRSFLFDANDASNNTAFAGGVGGGLWKTVNFKAGNITWSQITSVSPNLAITSVAQDPSNSNILYAGTGEGFSNADAIRGLGIYKSTDGGLNWSLLASTTTGGANENDFNYVQKIIVYNNGDVYASARSIYCNAGGTLRSKDGGATWTRVVGVATGACNTSTDLRGYDIEISASGDLYAATVDRSTGVSIGKVFKSPAGVNVGDVGTWANITPAGNWQRIELACSPVTNNRVYAMTQATNSTIGGIFRTDDGGGIWSNIKNANLWCDGGNNNSTDFSRTQAWYDLILCVKPDDDNTVYAGGVDIMKTTDAGLNWQQLTQWASGCANLPYVHADIHNIQYLPGSNTELAVSCDGGIFFSQDNGASFVDRNDDYNVTQYYSCALHPALGSNYMLAGAQDNGTHQFNAPGINAIAYATGGDGGFCFIDQKNPLQQITNYTGTSPNVSVDGGNNFTYLGSYSTDRFINPADYDTSNGLYFCGSTAQRLRRITDLFGAPIVQSFIISANTNLSVSAIKIDPNTPNRAWVAFSQASGAGAAAAPELYYIDNIDNAFSINAVTLPVAVATNSNYISSIDIESGDPNHVIFTLSNYGVQSVWESTNLGVNWTSLDNNGVNLPDIPVRWVKFIPDGFNGGKVQNVGGIIIATEIGVWSTNSISGNTTPWVENNTAMGRVRTDMIVYRGSDNVIGVATHGRGLFTSQFVNPLPVEFVSFKGSPLSNYNQLSWEISSQINNKGFDVERQYTGQNFTKIGFVPASNDTKYGFDDKTIDLSKTEVFYRLKQIDLNNDSKYSQTVSIKRTVSNSFIQYVSATKNNLLLKAGNKSGISKIQISVFDQTGRLVLSKENAYTDQNIDISRLAPGGYVIKCKNLNGSDQFVDKFVK